MQNIKRQIRAVFDDETVTVYQAYNSVITESAVRHQTFVSPPFKVDRMTWIKPSFLWMMYRSGWATKSNQQHILAIKITREGFNWALQNSCLSHYDPKVHKSPQNWKDQLQDLPVRVQWDPERDINMNKQNYRAIQIGLSGIAVKLYSDKWIREIEDITNYSHRIRRQLKAKNLAEARHLLPNERVYPFGASLESCS